ncbi:MAG: PIN domain-containing protein [Candidatus Bathyarchaeia archaeon]|nr:PIN domain-containing protein [Candidatus Bathyarchaeia archaeon]
MKSKRGTLKVLLDTSFILPTLGVDTGEEVLKGLKKLAEIKAEVCYSCFSILESLWIVARLSRGVDFDVERFRHGLRSVIESRKYVKIDESSDIFNDALRLHMLGHKDMVDNILYASSTHLNLKLLTLDVELKKFISNNRLTDPLIFPDEI